jgi:hypothetical protein
MPHAFFQDHHGIEEIFPLDGEKLLLGFSLDMSDLPSKYDPTVVSTHKSDEETNDPLTRTTATSTKSKSGPRTVPRSTACSMPAATWLRLTIRQRSLTLEQWPKGDAADVGKS